MRHTRLRRGFSGGPGLLALVLLAVAAPLHPADAQDAAAWPEPVVDPDDVMAVLDDPDVVVLHFGEKETYEAGHVPGAHFADTLDFKAPVRVEDGELVGWSLALPEPAELEEALRELGVDDDSRIVLYWDDGREARATRVLFTLDWAGLGDRSAVLLGGLDGWEAAGGSLTAEAPSPPARGNVSVRPRDELVVEADRVPELAETPGVTLIDGRAAAFYDGVREDQGVAGHIPGAENLPHRSLFTSEGTYRPLDEVQALLEEAGVELGDRLVVYCHIGRFGTAIMLAARMLGHDAVLYDGSWQDWAADDRPAATPPLGD